MLSSRSAPSSRPPTATPSSARRVPRPARSSEARAAWAGSPSSQCPRASGESIWCASHPPPKRPPPTAHRSSTVRGSAARTTVAQAPSTTLAQELASHYNADCTALQYLRDRLAGAHRSLVAEGTGARPLLAHTCARRLPGARGCKLVTVAPLTPQARSRTHGRAWLRYTRRARATPSSQRASTRQCWRCTASQPPRRCRCPGGPPSTRSAPRPPARARRRRCRRRPRPRRPLRAARSRRRRSS